MNFKTRRNRTITILICFLFLFTFSFPVLGVQDEGESDFDKARASITYEEMEGLTAGVLEGSIQDDVVSGMVKNAKFGYYKSMADELIALQQKKVDYLLLIDEQFRTVTDLYPDLCSLPSTFVECGEAAFYLNKDNKNEKLFSELNEFIIGLNDSGKKQELEDYWFAPGKKEMEDLPENGKNGVIKIITSGAVPPFNYIQDGKVVGFELDLIGKFCREYGYGVQVSISDTAGILAAVQSGKVDIGFNCSAKTPERLEVMSATETICIPHYSFVVRKDTVTEFTGVEYESEKNDESLITGIKESFKKTFIYEKRGKMVIDGTAVTIEITLLAALIGIFLGYLLYLMNKSGYVINRKIVYVFNSIMSGTPILVLLMVFYYIVFGKTTIDPFWVACVVFGLNFGSVMSVIYQSCFDNISYGQVEAALVLGYTERKAFGKFVVPQALVQILPLAKGQLVSLLKSTSVVGYVAIIDLTKAGDLIRSKTYEAFFPLISIAIIYFVLAWIIRKVIEKIEFKTDRVRQRNKALKKNEILENEKPEENADEISCDEFSDNLSTLDYVKGNDEGCIIKIEHLNKTYPGATPIMDLNAEINKGDIITVIGPSGTGKSTLIRCINRLETPTSGRIVVLGTDVTGSNTDLCFVRQKIGMVFQSFNLFEHLTCIENIIAAPMDIKNIDKSTAMKNARRLLEQVGLSDKEYSFPGELSGGQKQRVAIARALAMEPEILLLDEPTSALDPAMVKEVQNVIENLSKSGITMIIVSHDMSFAKHVSNKVFYLDEGVLYEEGSPSQIFDNPVKEKTRNFVESSQTLNLKYRVGNINENDLLVKIGRFALDHEISTNLTMKLYSLLDELIIVGMGSNQDVSSIVNISFTAKGKYVRFVLKISGEKNNILEQCDEISLKIINNIAKLNYSYDNNVNVLEGLIGIS